MALLQPFIFLLVSLTKLRPSAGGFEVYVSHQVPSHEPHLFSFSLCSAESETGDGIARGVRSVVKYIHRYVDRYTCIYLKFDRY